MAQVETETGPTKDLELLAVETLAGDIRDFLLDRLRNDHNPLPWNTRGEENQRQYIDAATSAAHALVRRVAHLIATKDRIALGAMLKKTAAKDHIAVELHVPLTHQYRHQLYDAVGSSVVIVLTDVDDFLGERGPVAINRDQPALFGDEPEND